MFPTTPEHEMWLYHLRARELQQAAAAHRLAAPLRRTLRRKNWARLLELRLGLAKLTGVPVPHQRTFARRSEMLHSDAGPVRN